MKKAMYRIMIDRLVVLMPHLLISAIMVMFLWLLLPLPFTVAAVCCMDITKHFAIYSHFRCFARPGCSGCGREAHGSEDKNDPGEDGRGG